MGLVMVSGAGLAGFDAGGAKGWDQAQKKPASGCESRPGVSRVLSGQKKRMVLVAILACSSSEQPALVGASAEVSVGLTKSLLNR